MKLKLIAELDSGKEIIFEHIEHNQDSLIQPPYPACNSGLSQIEIQRIFSDRDHAMWRLDMLLEPMKFKLLNELTKEYAST